MGTPPGKTAPRRPSHSLSLGDTTSTPHGPRQPRSPSSPEQLLTSGRAGVWGVQLLGDQPGLTRSLSLPVGTGASGPAGAGGCGRRRWAVSQSGAADGSSREQRGAMHTGSLLPPGWAINTHTSHTHAHTLPLADTLTLAHSHVPSLIGTLVLIHTHVLSHVHAHALTL